MLVVEGNDTSLRRMFARTPLLDAPGGKDVAKAQPSKEVRSVGAVLQPIRCLCEPAQRAATEGLRVELLAFAAGARASGDGCGRSRCVDGVILLIAFNVIPVESFSDAAVVIVLIGPCRCAKPMPRSSREYWS